MHRTLPYDLHMLLLKVANDDEHAFKILFDHYRGPFYFVACKMTGNKEIAQEIVQVVFVSIWVKRALLTAAAEPEAYLLAVLHNSIHGYFRKLTRERTHKARWQQAQSQQTEDPLETVILEKEKRLILESVIRQLPPQQRLIYKLAKQQGLSRDEIASRLNISPNTVRNHLASAICYLKEYLSKTTTSLIWLLIFMRL
ncbi:MAG TPA: RNA polymerase sigma-70 factor [Chitinophagaceae bacterium]|nr:RNA polymerase sigma-70 factor [Chitinophagaceae bacterium]